MEEIETGEIREELHSNNYISWRTQHINTSVDWIVIPYSAPDFLKVDTYFVKDRN